MPQVKIPDGSTEQPCIGLTSKSTSSVEWQANHKTWQLTMTSHQEKRGRGITTTIATGPQSFTNGCWSYETQWFFIPHLSTTVPETSGS